MNNRLYFLMILIFGLTSCQRKVDSSLINISKLNKDGDSIRVCGSLAISAPTTGIKDVLILSNQSEVNLQIITQPNYLSENSSFNIIIPIEKAERLTYGTDKRLIWSRENGLETKILPHPNPVVTNLSEEEMDEIDSLIINGLFQ